ncbi:MAG: aspartate--ammonia ligase [Erysipelotrichaceae bacterium]|nr:aspartate--ammonia ligase [Erysipelotrichaceae bacterium]
MENFMIPEGYHSFMDLKKTELAIKHVKDFFERELTVQLNLVRVSAPLFVSPQSGLNDNLNGVEQPVSFEITQQDYQKAEIVHSLAKWKRYALGRYGFQNNEGLYTDMNAIRKDEKVDNIHSIYVDQWDWEKIIRYEDRNIDTLKRTVRSVYEALKVTEKYVANKYGIEPILPNEIFFVTTQQLEDRYPNDDPKQREYKIAKEMKAVFVMQIGDQLRSGQKHDGRAPDYDDWKLNGDIIVYYPVLDIALELSSMGIRVDEKALYEQLEKSNCLDRLKLPFQKALMNKELPYTIGGGIGQSRICMFYLRKAHIGEVQCSLWPQEVLDEAKEHQIILL